eukprot:3583482-Pyramimonas_sp.AAC.1
MNSITWGNKTTLLWLLRRPLPGDVLTRMSKRLEGKKTVTMTGTERENVGAVLGHRPSCSPSIRGSPSRIGMADERTSDVGRTGFSGT